MPTPRIEISDVVIVGARCAGAATAMLLARTGHDVVMVDRAPFPSDTLSTHAIARGGVVQLYRWGLLDHVLASGAPAIRRVEFFTGDDRVVRTVKDRYGVDFLVAPRRHVLDPLIQGAAVDAGARMRTGTTVTGAVRNSAGRVIGITGRDGDGPIEVRARFVVGADGLKSRIARSVGARMLERRASASATHYAYFAGNWPAMEYHLGDGSFAGVFPTHSGEACVWVCAPDDWALGHRRQHSTIDAAFRAMIGATSPSLASRLHDAVGTSTARGMMSIPNQIVEPFRSSPASSNCRSSSASPSTAMPANLPTDQPSPPQRWPEISTRRPPLTTSATTNTTNHQAPSTKHQAPSTKHQKGTSHGI